jgi:hypothetical protein
MPVVTLFSALGLKYSGCIIGGALMDQFTRNIAQYGWDEVPDDGRVASQDAIEGAAIGTPQPTLREVCPNLVPDGPSTTITISEIAR